LVNRGLHGVKLIISDDHPGLKAARKAVFGSVLWQRCQFHLQQNAGDYVPRKSMRSKVAADIRAIFNAPNLQMAEKLLYEAVQTYAVSAPKLSVWLEENLHEGFTVFAFPDKHRRFIRTTNSLERVNREIRRRTRVVSIFPNDVACLRLASAILMEQDEVWQTGKRYCSHQSSNC
jgi:transposase-like protein